MMLKKQLLITLLLIVGTEIVFSQIAQDAFYQQEGEAPVDSSAVVTNSFWDNWYGQVGVDMSLQNPYGSNFLNTFPNGKSFGLDIAVGKWFTAEIGIRGKFNWENGIFKSDKAKWIQCTYYSLVADIQFNLHNLFGTYNPDRKWNLLLYPRMGALINNTSGEGSPLIGLGLSNSYRLNNRWSVYGDIAYQAVSNVLGFATGVGSGSNGFFDINLGVQIDLGYNKFDKASNKTACNQHSVATNTFWDNWFVQAGLGLSLLNPYGANFSHVFPNGKTLGINVGVGKWFSPDFGLRGGLNWQNGIVGNNHLKWMDPEGKPGANHDGGGYIAAYLDVFFNFHNIFRGYNEDRIWNAIVAPRVGLDSNLESGGASPLLGLVTEQIFKLNNRLKLFIDFAYQVTTSELMGDLSNTNKVDGASHSSSNGWFDLNVGIQYELGQTIGWNKPGEKRTTVADASGHNWPRFIVNTGASVVVAYGVKTVLKKTIKEERPDHSDNKSFPSGHASMAFAAARSIDKEFRKNCIWIPIAGYAVATAVGIERVVNKHHHWYDVVAGAGIGIGSAELTWWLSDLMFGRGSNIAVGSSGNTVDVALTF